MAALLSNDTPRCKRLALWAWVAAGACFLVLMYASFGWVGPAPAFLTWTAGAVPLFLITWRWRRKIGLLSSLRSELLTLLLWVLLGAAIPLVRTPTNQAPSPLQWALMVALVVFPVALTWRIIRVIDQHAPRPPGAA
jgi:O-antigen/teichoic acid export membrane protein